jgi:hypothetical protein
LANQTLKTRILLKTGTKEDWNKATNFTPLLGEVCIYTDRFAVYKEDGTLDYYVPGIKVGDGITNVNKLLYIGDEYITNTEIDSVFNTKIQSGTVINL